MVSVENKACLTDKTNWQAWNRTILQASQVNIILATGNECIATIYRQYSLARLPDYYKFTNHTFLPWRVLADLQSDKNCTSQGWEKLCHIYLLLLRKHGVLTNKIILKVNYAQGSYVFRNSKIQGFPGLFYYFFQGFSRVLEVQNEKQHSQWILITIKQQCASSVAIQY